MIVLFGKAEQGMIWGRGPANDRSRFVLVDGLQTCVAIWGLSGPIDLRDML